MAFKPKEPQPPVVPFFPFFVWRVPAVSGFYFGTTGGRHPGKGVGQGVGSYAGYSPTTLDEIGAGDAEANVLGGFTFILGFLVVFRPSVPPLFLYERVVHPVSLI